MSLPGRCRAISHKGMALLAKAGGECVARTKFGASLAYHSEASDGSVAAPYKRKHTSSSTMRLH